MEHHNDAAAHVGGEGGRVIRHISSHLMGHGRPEVPKYKFQRHVSDLRTKQAAAAAEAAAKAGDKKTN